MEADKNSRSLVKHLKTLGQQIRIDILKRLANSNNHLTYSQLQKDVIQDVNTSVNFSFHLNALKKCNLIISQEEGYFISKLGKSILENILTIEYEINKQSKNIMIRTSRYSKEPFDVRKIESFLQREGELEEYLAKNIAKEVKQRLFKTKIDYLTTPLMREYINGILLEKGLEEVRHKLTRLGTPPYEVSKLFDDSMVSPNSFIYQLGSDVSEQYLLLNLLPKDLADLYLSGQISLINLNSWSIKPLGIYINCENFFDNLCEKKGISLNSKLTFRELVNLLNDFNFLRIDLASCFSGDLYFGKVKSSILQQFSKCTRNEAYYLLRYLLLTPQTSLIKNQKIYPCYAFELNCPNKIQENDKAAISEVLLNDLFKDTINSSKIIQFPYFTVDYSQHNFFEKYRDLVDRRIKEGIGYPNFLFYNGKSANPTNSFGININPSHFYEDLNSYMILDKIFINLQSISEKASQNDDLFLEIVEKRIIDVLKLFKLKIGFLKRRAFENLYRHNSSYQYLDNKQNDSLDFSLKVISFLGLNSAITQHCGVPLDVTESSERFAINILKFMSRIIEENTRDSKGLYLLSQPHKDNLLNHSSFYPPSILGNNQNAFKLIRSETNLSLNKQIDVYKKFEIYLQGGARFQPVYNSEKYSIKDLLEILTNDEINAFTLSS